MYIIFSTVCLALFKLAELLIGLGTTTLHLFLKVIWNVKTSACEGAVLQIC